MPQGIQRQLLALMAKLHLRFAAIDLKLSGEDYTFFELNVQGQFLYIEILTGLPISAALADLLVSRHAHYRAD